jgi:hypothetical protein
VEQPDEIEGKSPIFRIILLKSEGKGADISKKEKRGDSDGH